MLTTHAAAMIHRLVCGLMRVKMTVELAPYFATFMSVATSKSVRSAANGHS